MAAGHYVNDSGAARRINEIWVNDSGTARQITEIWVNDNGVARMIFSGSSVQSFSGQIVRSGGVTVSFGLASSGVRTALDGEFGTQHWISPQSGMDLYEVRATETLGSVSSGTIGSWLSLSTTRTWTRTNTSPMSAQAVTLQLQFRRAADAVVVQTNTVTLAAGP